MNQKGSWLKLEEVLEMVTYKAVSNMWDKHKVYYWTDSTVCEAAKSFERVPI